MGLLPSGYTQLEWIGSSGTQYINTGFMTTQYMRVLADVEFTNGSSTSTYIFGGNSGSSWSVRGIGLAAKSDTYYYIFRSGTETSLHSGSISGKFTIDYNYNSITLSNDGGDIDSKSLTSNSNTSTQALYIFARNNNGTLASQATGRVYSFKIYSGTSATNMTLQMDLVPAKNSNNVVGLYDLENNQFYTNSGSGSFIAGPVKRVYLHYESSRGTAPVDKEIIPPYSLVAADLPTLTSAGYKFNGWYKEDTYVTQYKVDDVIYVDTILYAKWSEQITITYSTTRGVAPEPKLVNPPSYQLTANDLPDISVVGYKNVGWFLDQGFNNQAQVGTSITSDIILYAKFVDAPIIIHGKRKIEMNVFNGTTHDVLHPITEAEVIDYTKSGVLSTVGQVLSTTKDNMGNIVATATDIESRQHGMFIIAKDTVVPNSAWVSNSTYIDYPFRATVNITGCQPYYIPDVYFDVDDISLGIFAPISETGAGVVYIYASERPGKSITIPTIKLATEASNLSTVKVLATVDVTKKPYKTVYKIGDEVDYSGMIVKAYYSNGANEQLDFYDFTITPAIGTVFNTLGTENVVISYTENGVTKTASFTMSVEPPVEIVPWSTGTDAQIVAMVNALDAGTLTIAQTGWSVGDERNISLNSFQTYSSSYSSTTTQPAQTAKLVIMNQGGKILANNTNCHFVVGFKENVCKSYYDNDSNVYASSLLRTVENNIYNAIPSTIKPIFKQWNVVTGTYNGTAAGGANATSLQYFSSPAEKEITGSGNYSTSTEAGALTQLNYLSSVANRKHGNYSTTWWSRSPGYNLNYHACNVNSTGTIETTAVGATISGVSPIGCI